MSTENGLTKLSYARRNIELLRDRMEYLERFIADREAATGVKDTGVRAQEARALAWALPVLEAEWDHLWRLRTQRIPAAVHPKDRTSELQEARR